MAQNPFSIRSKNQNSKILRMCLEYLQRVEYTIGTAKKITTAASITFLFVSVHVSATSWILSGSLPH